MLKEQGNKATVTALSESLSVKKPSVDWALKKLGEAGLILHERYGDIDLTPEGSRIAEEVYRRHKALYSFLKDVLKVNPATAEQDACRMEHAMSRETINRLENSSNFMDCHPAKRTGKTSSNRFIEKGKDDRRSIPVHC